MTCFRVSYLSRRTTSGSHHRGRVISRARGRPWKRGGAGEKRGQEEEEEEEDKGEGEKESACDSRERETDARA